MARTPHADQPFLTFSRDHINVWSGGAGQPPVIGLSSQQLLDSEAACAAAEAAYQAMTAARNASKAATEAKDNAFAVLRAVIGADIDTIDAFGKATGDPGVWVKAQIPAPKDPSERTAPDAPSDLKATLQLDGSIVLSFKGATGGGAQYLVQRQTTGVDNVTSPYTLQGYADDEKRFVDNAVPEGLKSVGYRVAARLSTGLMSDWSVTYTVPFGSQSTNPAGSIAPVEAKDQKSAG